MKKVMIALVISFVLTSAMNAYSEKVCGEIENSMIRLHIIANSNSDKDQNIKLKIRDEILKAEGERLVAQTGQECEGTVKDRLDEMEQLAEKILAENGFSYGAHAEYGRFDFPKKQYKNMILPPGKYYGVRIVLGDGKGENWWCVLYPPLCMTNGNEAVLGEKSQKLLKENLSDEAYEIITQTDGEVNVKFYVVELAGEIKQYMKSMLE